MFLPKEKHVHTVVEAHIYKYLSKNMFRERVKNKNTSVKCRKKCVFIMAAFILVYWVGVKPIRGLITEQREANMS